MQMIYPKEKGPIWIDWKGAAEGGFRVAAYTDEDGEPQMAVIEIDAAGEMKARPEYQPWRAWCTTQLLRMPDGNTQLWKFGATVSPDCLLMKAKPVPSETYQTRVVSWNAEPPTTAF